MTQRDTPTRARASIWRPIFLDTLRETGNVALSAKSAGVERQTAYKARNSSKRFADQWDEALEEATDLLEAEARRRAYSGVAEPVYYQGDVVGHVSKYSDNLLIFLLKAHRPEKFRERHHVEVEGDLEVNLKAADSVRAKILSMAERSEVIDGEEV